MANRTTLRPGTRVLVNGQPAIITTDCGLPVVEVRFDGPAETGRPCVIVPATSVVAQ